jgi:hypothetical protein
VRHLNLDLDFDSLCAQAFNEEQSIKRNEALSKTNRDLALMDGNGKEKGPQANKGQQDSGKTDGNPKRCNLENCAEARSGRWKWNQLW